MPLVTLAGSTAPRTLALFVLFSLNAGIASAQEARSRGDLLGQPAPPLDGARTIEAPQGASLDWARLRGRVVVLEFWTTWCGPCVASFPHLNELVDQLSDVPVTFISMTNESETVVKPFLAKRPLRTWVATDPGGEVWRRYGVVGIPDTFVIDPAGRVAAITRPRHLTAAALRDLAAGRSVEFPTKDVAEGVPERAAQPPAPSWCVDEGRVQGADQVLSSAVIERSRASYPVPPFRDEALGVWSGDGWTRADLVRLAWDAAPANTDDRMPNSDERFRFAVQVPAGSPASQRQLLQDALGAAFRLRATWHEREKPAIVLKRAEGVRSGVRPSAGARQGYSFQFAAEGSHLQVEDAEPAKLATIVGLCVESVLPGSGSMPVVDDTGLAGRLDVDRVQWRTGDADSLREALGAVGLAWTVESRRVNVLVVEPGD